MSTETNAHTLDFADIYQQITDELLAANQLYPELV